MSPFPTLRQFVRGVCEIPKQTQARNRIRDIYRCAGERARCDELSDRIADLERQIETLRGALGQRVDEAEATALRNELAAERTKASDLERQLADVVKSHDMWHAQWREVQQQLTAEREAHVETRDKLERTDALVLRLGSERERAESDHDSLRAQLDAVTRHSKAMTVFTAKCAWDEGFRAGGEFALSIQSTPGGKPLDPPPNPYAGEPSEKETA